MSLHGPHFTLLSPHFCFSVPTSTPDYIVRYSIPPLAEVSLLTEADLPVSPKHLANLNHLKKFLQMNINEILPSPLSIQAIIYTLTETLQI